MRYTLSLPIAAMLMLSACNNDIFVERLDMPERQELSVDGDGGVVQCDIPSHGLKSASVGCDIYSNLKIEATDRNGKPFVKGSDPDLLGAATMTAPQFSCRIEFDTKARKLRFTSVENPAAYPVQIYIMLDYGYTETSVTVKVKPGARFNVQSTRLSDSIAVLDRSGRIRSTSYITNATDNPWVLSIRPYEGISCQGKLSMPDGWEAVCMSVAMPTANGDGGNSWTMHNVDFVGLSGGYTHYYRHRTESITVPPHSGAKITAHMLTARARGTLTLVAPVSGTVHSVPFEYTFYEPYDYSVTFNAKSD